MDAYGKNVTTITVNGNLAKYIHSKNAFKTVLARLEAEIINFLCFEAFGRRLYGCHLYGRRLYGQTSSYGSYVSYRNCLTYVNP